jgi:hypothetical protein
MKSESIKRTLKSMCWGKFVKSQSDTQINDKKNLIVYICFDFPYVIDETELLTKLNKYIDENVNEKYNLIKIQEIIVNMPAHLIYDTLQEGMDIFTRMTYQLNLKNIKEEVWFMYIATGYIKNIINGSTVILLNKNPKEYNCKYIINRNVVDLKKYSEYTDDIKEINIKNAYNVIKRCINELFKNTNNTICYTNIDPIYKN